MDQEEPPTLHEMPFREGEDAGCVRVLERTSYRDGQPVTYVELEILYAGKKIRMPRRLATNAHEALGRAVRAADRRYEAICRSMTRSATIQPGTRRQDHTRP